MGGRNGLFALVAACVVLGAWTTLRLAGASAGKDAPPSALSQIPPTDVVDIVDGSDRVISDFESGWSITGERASARPAVLDGHSALDVSARGGPATVRLTRAAFDLADSSFRIRLRSPDWSAVRGLYLTFGSVDLANAFRVQLVPLLPSLRDDEWQTFTFGRSDFEVEQGRPSWHRIAASTIRVFPRRGRGATVSFDRLEQDPIQADRAMISFAFDDGYRSVLQARRILRREGLAGTVFAIPEREGRRGFLDRRELDLLDREGWDISGHGARNLTTISRAEASAHIQRTSAYLRERGYRGRSIYTYPNGGNDGWIRQLVSSRFTWARGTSPTAQSTSLLTCDNLTAKQPGRRTTTRQLRRWIDDAVRNDEFLILAFHRIGITTDDPEDAPARLLRDAVRWAKQADADVVPVSVALTRASASGARNRC